MAFQYLSKRWLAGFAIVLALVGCDVQRIAELEVAVADAKLTPRECSHLPGCEHSLAPIWLCECPRRAPVRAAS